MTASLSVYLDALRFLAAMIVLLSHLSGHRFTGGWLWQFSPYGYDAVMVFFVLSGFVIGYVTDTREKSAGSYSVSRLARIYSVVIPAIVLTLFLDAVGGRLAPDLYPVAAANQVGGVASVAGSLVFLNAIWGLDFTPGTNIAYWSLGYECWYYAIFGVLLFARPPWNVVGMGALLLLVGPKIASLFPLWLLGVGAYHACSVRLIGRTAGACVALASVAGWIIFENWRNTLQIRASFPHDTAYRWDLLRHYALATAFALHLVGMHAALGDWRFAAMPARAIRFLANRTFSIYILHVPVAQFLITIIPWPPGSWPGRLSLLLGTLGVIFAVAQVTECRRDPWRMAFARLLRVGEYGKRPADA